MKICSFWYIYVPSGVNRNEKYDFMGLIVLQVKELLRGDYYNQLENVKMHFSIKKDVIVMHWNSINTTPNPFEAFSCTYVVKDVGICLKFLISKLIRGGHLF